MIRRVCTYAKVSEFEGLTWRRLRCMRVRVYVRLKHVCVCVCGIEFVQVIVEGVESKARMF